MNIGRVSLGFRSVRCFVREISEEMFYWATLKAGIRKPESGIRNPESGIRNPELRMMTEKFTLTMSNK